MTDRIFTNGSYCIGDIKVTGSIYRTNISVNVAVLHIVAILILRDREGITLPTEFPLITGMNYWTHLYDLRIRVTFEKWQNS